MRTPLVAVAILGLLIAFYNGLLVLLGTGLIVLRFASGEAQKVPGTASDVVYRVALTVGGYAVAALLGRLASDGKIGGLRGCIEALRDGVSFLGGFMRGGVIYVIVLAVIVAVTNFIVDVIAALIDPRVRY